METGHSKIIVDGKESEFEVGISENKGRVEFAQETGEGKHSFTLKCADEAGNERETPVQEFEVS